MSFLRKLAFPLSLIYGLVVKLRNKLFDLGVFTGEKFTTPIICVGNLSVGGTGKTPMVEYLIDYFQDTYKVAVLSRGYKRKSNGYILASAESTVADLGDEPYQIYSKFPSVAVAVDADRRNGIAHLETSVKPDIILLDDAFQHRSVKADLNMLLTSYGQLYVDDWYLPTGNLRDSVSQARRANYIIITKCPVGLSKNEQHTIIEKLALEKNQKVLFSYLKYDRELQSSESSLSLDTLHNRLITLVTGIANPEPLVQYLKNENLSFDHLPYKDHHFFSPREVEELNGKDIIVTTEKDYMRLEGKVKNIFYLKVSHAFLDDGETVLKKGLAEFMKLYS